MLYGALESDIFLRSVRGAGGARRQSKWLISTLKLCAAVNRDTHQIIPLPQNWDELPPKLTARLTSRPENKKEWFKAEQSKYLAMSEDAKQRSTGMGEPNYGNYMRMLGGAVMDHKVGNCQEYSALVIARLRTQGVSLDRIRLVSGKYGKYNNHLCVALDVAADADPGKPVSYGANCVICDPWLDLVSTAELYFEKLAELKAKFKPTEILPLTESVI